MESAKIFLFLVLAAFLLAIVEKSSAEVDLPSKSERMFSDIVFVQS